ncbi:hypothetical protein M9Y10_016084 [Tritrichomonas musculus]|uniref:sn-1-specific diacylglycerol lipase n=1 Tax=Tritrichomonas musculus TaxID=1915356 RepID=A0ABR2I5K0_9EUKA
MKLFHSKSRSNTSKDSNNNDSGSQKKFRRSSSVFFDPTTQVNRPFPDLIWKMAFHRLPLAPTLNAATLTSNEVTDLLHCTLLSHAVYLKKKKRNLPPNLSNIVYECKESDFYRVPYFIVNSEELDTIFIVFRGSKCLKDWHVDFLAAAIQYEQGYVHEGVYFTSLNIFTDIKEKIRDLSISHNKRQVIITGHSLGGAVAGLTTILFNQEYADMNVRAVCLAPVASLSPEIWELTHNYIRSYINYGDLVPFISYYNTYYLPEDSLPKIPYEQLNHWCVKKINTHSKRPEFRSLVENFTQPVSQPYKLVPPGVAKLIRVVDKKKAIIEMQAIEDSMSYFGQFVKNLSAMKHPIKLYRNSIIRYFSQFFEQDEELINYYRLSRRHKHHRHRHHKHNDRRKGSDENNKYDENEDDNMNYNYNDDDDDENNQNYNYNDDDDENNRNYNYNDDDDDDEENENENENVMNYNYNDDSDNDDENNRNYNEDEDDD